MFVFLFVICHKFPPSIRHNVLNYISTTKSYDGTPINICKCDTSPYKNPIIGHVITGDLTIIKNRKLRNILCKGINHRECRNVPKTWILKTLLNDIECHINTSCQALKVSRDAFTRWKEKVTQ